MIVNAKNKKISNGNLPNMSETIVGWFLPIRIGIVTREVVDFEQVETIKWVDTQGVVQQYHTENLVINKDGDRSWDWIQIHCLPDLQLENDKLKEQILEMSNKNMSCEERVVIERTIDKELLEAVYSSSNMIMERMTEIDGRLIHLLSWYGFKKRIKEKIKCIFSKKRKDK